MMTTLAWVSIVDSLRFLGLRRSVPHVRILVLAFGDEFGQRLVDRGIERGRLIFLQQPAPARIGALVGIAFALVAPLLEGVIVGRVGIPERRLVIRQRMGATEEMLARADLAEGA